MTRSLPNGGAQMHGWARARRGVQCPADGYDRVDRRRYFDTDDKWLPTPSAEQKLFGGRPA